jgi:pimeloyl-ACP methyl ester carboxylesterase
MRRITAVMASALVELIAMAVEPAAAQSASPVTKFETEPFSGSELLNGKRITEDQCASLPGAVWVVVDRQGECIRYFHATTGSRGSEAVVFIGPDVVAVNGRGEARPFDSYLAETPAGLQNGSASWSRALNVPYVHLARPGTHGSSGEHGKRRTLREIDLVSAALDAIKSRHGYTGVHVAGYGEGGLIAAALLAKRSDLGCVVLASGLLSVRSHLAERGETTDVLGNKNPLDPITMVDRIAKRPELRVIVVTDPDDVLISARSQTLYAKRLVAAGLPVRQVFAAAPDANAHGLFRVGRQIAASCAKGMAEDMIVATYQNKLPTTPPDADDPPLHPSDVMTHGVNISEAQCKSLATALWVRVDGRAFCVRYWQSIVGDNKDEAQVYFHGDLGDPKKGRGVLSSTDARATAGGLQREARAWARLTGMPYFSVGRLTGACGGSTFCPVQLRTIQQPGRTSLHCERGLRSSAGLKPAIYGSMCASLSPIPIACGATRRSWLASHRT